MRKHKYILYLILSVLLLGGTAYAIFFGQFDEKNAEEESSTAMLTERMETYSFREIQDMMLRLAGDDEERKESMEHLIDPLYLSSPVDARYIMEVSKVLGLDDGIYTDLLFGTEMDSAISRKQFDMYYQRVLDSGKIDGLTKEVVYVRKIIDATTVSDGYRDYAIAEFLINEKYLGKIVSVYAMEDVIFKISSVSDAVITYKNVWCTKVTENALHFFMDGKLDCIMIGDYSGELDVEDSLVNISFDNEGIRKVEKAYVLYKTVTDIGEDYVELNHVKYDLAEDYAAYNVTRILTEADHIQDIETHIEGEIADGETEEIRVASKMLLHCGFIEAVMENGKVKNIFLRENNLSDKKINVLIRSRENGGLYHNVITVSSDTEFAVSRDGSTKKYEAGASINVKKNELKSGIIRVQPLSQEGKLTCLFWGTNYDLFTVSGKLTIRGCEEGLILVNTFSMEEYLVNNTAGMLATSENEEVDRAIAVVARTNAESAIRSPKYEEYGADTDDSLYDYMFSDKDREKRAYLAVMETYGDVLSYNGEGINAYYYMTSAGVANSNADFWEEEEQKYYTPHFETMKKEAADISEETSFASFIGNSKGLQTIEKNEPFYRWHVDFDIADISNVINQRLKELAETNAENTPDTEGALNTDDDTMIGDFLGVEITRRSKGGSILELRIIGSVKDALLTGQSNIRSVFSPADEELILNDGSKRTGWDVLPSTSFYVRVDEEVVHIVGGGFGSGVGLSQSGAMILAEEGMKWNDILVHYYSGCKIIDTYK